MHHGDEVDIVVPEDLGDGNDMAGDEEDSWKTILEQAGFGTDAYLKGLGENPAYQEIYLQHVRDAIIELNRAAGKTA